MNEYGRPIGEQQAIPGGYSLPPAGYSAPNYHNPSVISYGGSHKASFGQRFLALLVDSFIIGAILTILIVPLAIFGISRSETESAACIDADGRPSTCENPTSETILVWLAIFGLYFFMSLLVAFVLQVRPVYRTGQTIGRSVVGIKVVDINNGSLLSGGRAVGRYLFANVISANIMYLGYLWMLWDDQKQTLHDKVTNSTVIQT